MYNEYFGFREKPFNVTPDPKYFYENPVYQEAYASLLYGIRERKGFIVLTGEVGTGKTTLLRRLMSEPEEDVRYVFFYNTTLSFEELVSFACDELRLDVKGAGRLEKIRALNEFLMRQSLRGGTVVLLVDEAQNLTDDVLENLRLVSNLETPTEKLLQIVLVGQTELDTKLSQPQLRQIKQRVALHCRLDRLKEREVGPFIQHRLHIAGYDRELFTREAIQAVALYSRGIPRLINILCDNALLIGYAASETKVSAEMVQEVAGDLSLRQENRLPEAPPPAPSPVAPVVEPPPVNRAPIQPASFIAARVEKNEPPVRPTSDTFPRQRDVKRPGIFGPTTLSVLVLVLAGVVLYQTDSLGWWSDLLARIRSAAKTSSASSSRHEPIASEARPAPSSEPATARPVEAAVAKTEVPGTQQASTADSESAAAEPTKSSSQQNNAVVVSWGTTISRIAAEAYGRNRMLLAMDILKEANPGVEDVNWIVAGQNLSVPPLTRDTLLRRQSDDSYSLVLDSFSKRQDAERFSKAISAKGYDPTISQRQISPKIVLYRVEIRGLKNQQAAYQAWDLAAANRWVDSDTRATKSR
jgi:general secretion pathway protein A